MTSLEKSGAGVGAPAPEAHNNAPRLNTSWERNCKDDVRDLIIEALGPAPAHALAAHVAIYYGDLTEARAQLADLITSVKEAMRLFKMLEGRAGS